MFREWCKGETSDPSHYITFFLWPSIRSIVAALAVGQQEAGNITSLGNVSNYLKNNSLSMIFAQLFYVHVVHK